MHCPTEPVAGQERPTPETGERCRAVGREGTRPRLKLQSRCSPSGAASALQLESVQSVISTPRVRALRIRRRAGRWPTIRTTPEYVRFVDALIEAGLLSESRCDHSDVELAATQLLDFFSVHPEIVSL